MPQPVQIPQQLRTPEETARLLLLLEYPRTEIVQALQSQFDKSADEAKQLVSDLSA